MNQSSIFAKNGAIFFRKSCKMRFFVTIVNMLMLFFQDAFLNLNRILRKKKRYKKPARNKFVQNCSKKKTAKRVKIRVKGLSKKVVITHFTSSFEETLLKKSVSLSIYLNNWNIVRRSFIRKGTFFRQLNRRVLE